MSNKTILINIVRAAFVMVACLLGIALALSFGGAAWQGALLGTAFALFFVMVDGLLKHVTIGGFSGATFGLMTGVFCAWLITRIGIFDNPWMQELTNYEAIRNLGELMLYASLGFLGITLAMRSDREDFSLVIPYVRFRKETTYDQPVLLDSNVIIDGRLPAIWRTGFISGAMVVPRFVIDELQLLADSRDEVRSARGKRGLESLDKLHGETGLELTVYEAETVNGQTVDARLVELARSLGARLLTNDQNLGKVAGLSKVPVLNLNRLADSLRSQVIAGDSFDLELVKEGREEGQAVGHLPDGTMIVVNKAKEDIGQKIPVTVTSALQTSAGRLVFAERSKAKAGN